MGDARVEVIPLPRPAIIVLHNIETAPDDDGTWLEQVTTAVAAAAGHHEFVIFRTWDDGTVKLVTDPTDGLALIEAAIRQTQEAK